MPTIERLLDEIERRGGIASTRELTRDRIDREFLLLAGQYGRILRVRKGWWAHPDLPAHLLEAHRAGGRLACVSALAHHGVIAPIDGRVHVSAPEGVRKWRPGRRRADVVRHWSRHPCPGDRMAVTVDAALAQFALCREVSSRDVRLADPHHGPAVAAGECR